MMQTTANLEAVRQARQMKLDKTKITRLARNPSSTQILSQSKTQDRNNPECLLKAVYLGVSVSMALGGH